ncbi:MAG: exodeoxyribonuclease V subunit beta [Candidatus Binatia bacterium]
MSLLDVELLGTHLVEASAGTGKTHAITTLFVRLLLEHGLGVERILVVTYTNAATAELRDRIRSRIAMALLGCKDPSMVASVDRDVSDLLARRREHAAADAARLALALQSFDEAAISTIHGFCQRVLQEQAFESSVPFDAELLTDERPLREEVLRDFWVRTLAGADDGFVGHLATIGLQPSSLGNLVRKVLGDPHMRIVPETAEAPPLADLALWRRARDAVLAAWAADRGAVEKILRDSPALNRTTYRAEAVENWIRLLDGELSASLPLGEDVRFQHLSRSGLAAGTKKGFRPPTHRFFDLCEELWRIDRAIVASLAARELALKRELVREVPRKIALRKGRRSLLSFDDLLQRVHEALHGEHGGDLAGRIRARYAAALVDEFQDTDAVQYEIFKRVWLDAGEPLVLVGDPKQAIYAFRGADVHTYLVGQKAATARHALTVNHRSDPGLLRALNLFFGRSADPFLVPGIEYVAVDAPADRIDVLGPPDEMTAPLRILFLPSDDGRGSRGYLNRERIAELPLAVAADIVRLLERRLAIPERASAMLRPVHPGDIAVLCRTNLQARTVQEALHALGIPTVLSGDRSVFESAEAHDLLTVLSAAADPTNAKLVRAALATSLIGLSANRLCEVGARDEEWDRHATRFLEWNTDWIRHGFMRMMRRILDDEQPGGGKIAAAVLGLPQGERRLTNVLHLAELLHESALSGHRGPHELVDWLRHEIDDAGAAGELAPEKAQIRLESDAEAVVLTTIHKAKGLEWPFVYCPYLWVKSEPFGDDLKHVRYHDDDGRLALDLGSADLAAHRQLASGEARAENLRLLYVALTRARHQCSLVWGGFKTAKESSLGHFLAPPRVDTRKDASMLRELESLARESGGTIAIRKLALDGPAYRGEARSRDDLELARFERGTLDGSWRTASFTALAAADRRLSTSAREGFDLDEVDVEPRAVDTASEGEVSPLADFPAGARAGSLLHEILERIDFARRDRSELGRVIEERLAGFGFDPGWKGPLERALEALLETTLRAGELRLRLVDVPLECRSSEMEFTLPLGSESARSRLRPESLGAVFSAHPSAAVPIGYADRVAALGFREVAGYLRGYVDLVFEHAGRFFLVDWKSNFLGSAVDGYRRDRLAVAMASHHYILQYHLYVAMLDRYLRRRRSHYDYDRHFGGVLYVFLRGVVPRGDGETGVYFDHPPARRIAALSRLIHDPAEAVR